MISRLSAIAAVFAILATASLSYATGMQHRDATGATAAMGDHTAAPARTVRFETVVVTGKRAASAAN